MNGTRLLKPINNPKQQMPVVLFDGSSTLFASRVAGERLDYQRQRIKQRKDSLPDVRLNPQSFYFKKKSARGQSKLIEEYNTDPLFNEVKITAEDKCRNIERKQFCDWNMSHGFPFTYSNDIWPLFGEFNCLGTIISKSTFQLANGQFLHLQEGKDCGIRRSPGLSQLEHLMRLEQNLTPGQMSSIKEGTIKRKKQQSKVRSGELINRLQQLSRSDWHNDGPISDSDDETYYDSTPLSAYDCSLIDWGRLMRRDIGELLDGQLTWQQVYSRVKSKRIKENEIGRYGLLSTTQKTILFFGATKLGFLAALSHPNVKLPDGSAFQALDEFDDSSTTKLRERRRRSTMLNSQVSMINFMDTSSFEDRWGVVRDINGPFWPIGCGPIMSAPQKREYGPEAIRRKHSSAREDALLQQLFEVRKTLDVTWRRPMIVYDSCSSPPLYLRMEHTQSIASQTDPNTPLLFESRFESGNLQQARRIGPWEYELVMSPDFCTTRHTQWYFFVVAGAQAGVQYTFRIVNFLKPNSLYKLGLQPLFHSKALDRNMNAGWLRVGTNIRYERNNDQKPNPLLQKDTTYYAMQFKMVFPCDDDICTLAHCFPYTFTDLKYDVKAILHRDRNAGCIRRHDLTQCDTLCSSFAGNSCFMLTVTDPDVPDASKFGALLTARVHPGETNSSWVMKGLMDFLTDPKNEMARDLRRRFLFKIIPMLNADGVIVGNYRCSLIGKDVNRTYIDPDENMFPEVNHVKKVIKNLQSVCKEVFACDFHGHSHRFNSFIYGCDSGYRRMPSSVKSNITAGRTWQPKTFLTNPEEFLIDRMFCFLVEKEDPNNFTFRGCRFAVQPDKEGTSRVAFWREFHLTQVFTHETSLCGSILEGGKLRQFEQKDLEEIGQCFGTALLKFHKIKTDEEKYTELLTEMGKEMLQNYLLEHALRTQRRDKKQRNSNETLAPEEFNDQLAEDNITQIVSSVNDFKELSKAISLLDETTFDQDLYSSSNTSSESEVEEEEEKEEEKEKQPPPTEKESSGSSSSNLKRKPNKRGSITGRRKRKILQTRVFEISNPIAADPSAQNRPSPQKLLQRD